MRMKIKNKNDYRVDLDNQKLADKARRGYERSADRGQKFDSIIDRMPASHRDTSKPKNVKYDLSMLRIARSERKLPKDPSAV